MILIKNAHLYNSDSNEVTDILIHNNSISRIEKNIQEETAQIIDAGGRTLAPGFIEVHLQGAGGSDILDNSSEALNNISKALGALGTTLYLGTTVVKPETDNAHLKTALEFVNKETGGAVLAGFHLEGPFINIRKKGGLNPTGIYEPSERALEEILELLGSSLKMMTIAPELPGNLKLIKNLVKNGTVASFAHSDAGYEETKAGFDAGINHVTHMFNAMNPLNHRAPGPIAAIAENKNVTAQLISDGHHLHPAVVNLAYSLLGAERCICITDGMQAMGLPEGRYTYNGREYTSKDGAARYDDGTLIGSTMSLGNIALKFREFTGCSLKQAIDTVTVIPAKLLGIYERKGSIEAGKDADIVIFDNDMSIHTTIIAGKAVYRKAQPAG